MKNVVFVFVTGLLLGSVTGALFAPGATVAPVEEAHDHSTHGEPHDDDGPLPHAGHDHTAMVEATEPVPSVDFVATPEPGGGLNLNILLQDFAFAPEQVNGPDAPGAGHAHVYVNGRKMLRAYGPWVHIANLPTGPAEVRVTLNANSHGQLAHDGQPIDITKTVEIE
ncbi:hypothetical protein ATO6_06830 [Oceanicola sp. 22II-s10i]|uniref:hypothetical protein n=1 Tax=Oceanicola sp. 22II-s10i TaxID=1317116 RepID=UPI000B5229F2|nr:hypothetical protein [Oceanicola sp. 22II-s10i]OWU86508.1 hypothetical protein ATO6_06830 [Oceanicola sp. 22II-s10i]